MRFGYRDIGSVIIGLLLLLPVLAMVFLQLGKTYIQLTREERLNTETLVTVILPATNVLWEEAGRELWVGNRMFDVASYHIINGNYHLTGVFDNDETEVAGSLLHGILSNNSDGLLQLLLLMQGFLGGLLLLELSLRMVQNHKKRTNHFCHLRSRVYPILGPPPRGCFVFSKQLFSFT